MDVVVLMVVIAPLRRRPREAARPRRSSLLTGGRRRVWAADVAVGSSNGCNSPRVELRNHLYPSTYIFARAVLQENAPGSPRRVFERIPGTSLGGRFDNENFDDPREGFALARSAPIAEPKRAPKDRQVLRAESQWEKRRDHRRALCIENECCHSAMFAAIAVAVMTRRRRAADLRPEQLCRCAERS